MWEGTPPGNTVPPRQTRSRRLRSSFSKRSDIRKRSDMAISTAPLPEPSAWNALAAHHRQIKGVHMRELFAKDPNEASVSLVEAAGIYLDYSKNRITDETLDLLLRLAEEADLARPDRCYVRWREDQHVGKTRRSARRAASAERTIDPGRWRERGAERPCRARPDGRFLQSGAWRHVAWPHRQTNPQRDQYRHRRLRSRPGDGL